MSHKIYNTAKNRKATLNEVAKHLIVDRLDAVCAIQECWGAEDLTDKEAEKVALFYEKHFKAIKKRLNPNNIIR